MNDRDRPVTEQVCQLRHKDIDAMKEEMKALSSEIKKLRENEIPHLTTSMISLNADMQKCVGEMTITITGVQIWQKDHEQDHNKGIKYVDLFLKVGGWVITLLTFIVLLILQLKK